MKLSTAHKSDREFAVLLVEDDPSALEELSDIVDLEGWTPITAGTVVEALDILARTPEIGVVVTDVHFATESGESDSGIQLISRAQARFPDRALSFVVLSGDPGALRSSVQTGAVDFLNKPLNSQELVTAIETAWQSGGRERSVTELTSFLMEKTEKATQALLRANQDLATAGGAVQRDADDVQSNSDKVRTEMQNGNLLPWFQPQVDMKTGRFVGFDTVPCWVNASGGAQPAAPLIEMARKAGIAKDVRGAIRAAAIRGLGHFTRSGLEGCRLNLPLSKECLESPGTVDSAIAEAQAAGLDPSLLMFELPQGLDLGGAAGEAIRGNLASMPGRSLKVKLSEDAGSLGIAALQGIDLSQINFDFGAAPKFHLKADQQAVVSALMELARAMGMDIAASGVATPYALKWLADQGCSTAQGPQIAQAIPGDHALTWAKSNLSRQMQEA